MEEIDKPMYYGAKPETFEAARILRKHMTPPEKLLWKKLCKNQVCSVRFRRQHPIDFFIVDFYCHEARLALEIDGEIHNFQRGYDDGRSAEMERFFIKVIRFSNAEVENDIDKVVKRIENEVIGRIKSPPWGI